MKKSVRVLISVVLTVILFCALASAQVATGTPEFGTFSNGPDVINIGNLNVNWTIPVLNKTGRGQNFVYNLAYNSSIWYPMSVNGSEYWEPVTGWGWQGILQQGQVYISEGQAYITYAMSTSSGSCGQYNQYQWQSWTYNQIVYVDQFGISHYFQGASGSYFNSPGTADQCPPNGANPPGTLPAQAIDGSGLTLYFTIYQGYITAYVVTPKGTTINPPLFPNSTPPSSWNYSSIDSNGNEITGISGTYTDTTGNTALTITGNTQANTETFAFTNSSGSASKYVVNYSPYNILTNFGCSSVPHEYSSNGVYLASTITLPDNSTYQFTYEGTPGHSGYYTGRLASVTLPTGNTITYQYTGGSNGIMCGDGSTAGLTRTLNSISGSAAQTWTYARTQPNGSGTSHTEVVDGLGNHLNYDFVEASNQTVSPSALYFETHRNVYQGAESGTPVIARYTCYNGSASPCLTTIPSLPFGQIDTYETLNGLETHGTTAMFNIPSAVETESETWDFASGTTSRGPLLREEVWTYGYSLAGVPTKDEVFDGNSNEAGETTYAYDQNTPTASSGVPQHIAATGPRGNLTTETVYASSGTSYSMTATYEDTGSVLTTTTPNGTTTLTYDPTFVYSTGVSLPTPSSGVALAGSESFDTTYTGLPLTTTDLNGQVTTVSTYDELLRPTLINFPDGGKTQSSYTANQSSIFKYQNSGTFVDTEILFDGYGRLSRTALSNGQSANPWYQQDSCYDANGNLTFQAYPYQGDGWATAKVCSGAGDTYTYDVLGRVTNLTRGDGETRSYTYSGRAVESVDENGVTQISQVDGLGRPTIVCEISSNSSMPGSGSPASCGTDIAGTGFATTYSYSLKTGTTTVTQGVQTRTFQSDWLGRPILVQEPESGQTTYSYAYNSTGLAVTRTRPKANQPSASVHTTTTSQYDSLGRVLSVTYSDGTFQKNFSYDASAGADFTDLTQTNLKGRLSLASGYHVMTAFSYDPMGRTNYLDDCFQSGPCGTVSHNHKLQYTYDWTGNLLSSTDDAGVTSTYTVSRANELLSLTSSLSNSTNPANLISGMQNGPFGPGTYSLGNGLTSVSTYDTLGRVSGGYVCGGTSQPGCTGGTQTYGFTSTWNGVLELGGCDTALNQCISYGYDQFNRLTSRNVTTSPPQNYTYTYDRWGNRWNQTPLNGGLTEALSFNTANNQVTTSGYTYDAAGNMTDDNYHSYTYDAEGNITAVDSGSTASYLYNALNQRVQTVVASAPRNIVFNAAGQRVTIWNANTGAQTQGQYYWGGKRVAFYSGGSLHFQHQDWMGTERARTTYNGGVEGTFASLPFGDGLTTVSGTDLDAYHFATVDHDYEDETDHAQFRQYSEAQGRWLSPDPYGGSYDFTNPQSLNRYVYALNNPLSAVDPSGQNLVDCSWGCGGYSDCANDPNCTAGDDGGGDGGGGAVVDSMPQTIYTTLGSNMLAPCPNNVCSYFNAAGQWMNYQYMVVGAYYASSGPGSIFWNVESAGIAAVEYSDPMSIIAGLEYWGNLYEDQNGVYSFTTGEWGESDSSDFNPYAIPSGTIYVGDYHDHGGFSSPDAEVFSPAGCNGNPNQLCDIGLAMSPLNLGGGIFFLGTPMGRVEMFNPASAGALPNGCVLVGTPVSALAAASPPRPSVPVCQ